MPLEAADLDNGTDGAKFIFRCFASSTSLPGVGTFGREAQAAYLLDRVLMSVDGEGMTDAQWTDLFTLDQTIQPFLCMVMDQVGGRWGYYCGATALAIT